LSEVRAEPIPDPGWTWPSLILTSTAGGRKPQGSSTRVQWKATHDSDPRFNAILSRCVQGANRPDRTVICPNLTPDRLEP
ncbi:hypothetical protein PanWU01x14_369310, partial [Parasponia andersonii]